MAATIFLSAAAICSALWVPVLFVPIISTSMM